MSDPCPSGKDQYLTKQHAWASITRHRMRNATGSMSPYLCPDCNKYHLRSDLRFGRERKRR